MPRFARYACWLPSTRWGAARMACGLLLLLLCIAACAPFALTRPVTKLGLLAPFEGAQHALGYEALYAVKLALREQNAVGGAAGWQIELVALDRDDQPDLALRQARALAVDPDVTYAISLATAAELGPQQQQFAALALPVVFVDPGPAAAPAPDSAFVERYRALSGGVPPGALAVRTYAAARAALAHIAGRVSTQGRPAR